LRKQTKKDSLALTLEAPSLLQLLLGKNSSWVTSPLMRSKNLALPLDMESPSTEPQNISTLHLMAPPMETPLEAPMELQDTILPQPMLPPISGKDHQELSMKAQSQQPAPILLQVLDTWEDHTLLTSNHLLMSVKNTSN